MPRDVPVPVGVPGIEPYNPESVRNTCAGGTVANAAHHDESVTSRRLWRGWIAAEPEEGRSLGAGMTRDSESLPARPCV